MVDTIVLYESTETEFKSNGLGSLAEATKCEVTEERNGEFELELEYPILGRRYSDITMRRIILAKPNPYDRSQPFRIYNISTPINGVITVNARHIRYDASGIPVRPFSATGCANALKAIKSNSAVTNPFTYWTDKEVLNTTITTNVPMSANALLGGTEGSILDIFGTGEYEFDRYDVKFHLHRGDDNGVTIRYGKNLTDLTQEQNCESVYTGVYPYWYNEDEGLVEATNRIVYVDGDYDYVRILPVDFTSDYESKPTAAQLQNAGASYISKNNIGVPSVSLSISFINLSQCGEYDVIEMLEKVRLCDTVHVEFPKIGISAKAKCITTVYDAISGKYVSLEIGDSKSNLASTISEASAAADGSITAMDMQQAINHATNLITGNKGGYIFLRDTNGDKCPDELLIMDTDSVKTAKNVWRFNKAGLAHSSTGYNGTYSDAAITADGRIMAKYLYGLVVSASEINGGTLSGCAINIGNGAFTVDSSGRMDATSGYIGGLTIATNSLYGTSTTISGSSVSVGSSSVTSSSVSSSSVTASTTTVDSSGVTTTGSRTGLYYSTGSSSMGVFWDPSGWTENHNGSPDLVPSCAANLAGWTDFVSAGGGFYGYTCQVSDSLIVNGSSITPGTKSVNMHTDSYGEHLLFCYETPTRMFGDIGRAELDEIGTCYVYLDDTFLETINTNADYNIFLQKYGSGDVWVEDVQPTYFVVNGTPGLKFAWELKANQIGDNNTYLEVPTERDTTTQASESAIQLVVDYEIKTIAANDTQQIEEYQDTIIQSDTSSSDIEDYLYSLL